MSDEQILAYLQARQTLIEVTGETEGVLQRFHATVGRLRGWKKSIIEGTEVKFRIRETVPSQYVINVTETPTWTDIAKALARWREANWAVQEKWDALPEQRRRGLQPPPT